MIEQKDQVIIISCCVVLIIVVGLLLTFFGSFINQVNTQKYASKIKNAMDTKLLYNKWILMVIIFNFLIMAGYVLMYLQLGKTNSEVGLTGDPGEQGDKGQDFKGCC